MPSVRIKSSDDRKDTYRNITFGLRLTSIIAAAAVLAMMMSFDQFLPLFSVFLLASGVFRGIAAALAQVLFWERHFNQWDETAALICIGLFVNLIHRIAAG